MEFTSLYKTDLESLLLVYREPSYNNSSGSYSHIYFFYFVDFYFLIVLQKLTYTLSS